MIYCQNYFTLQKFHSFSFLTGRMVGGDEPFTVRLFANFEILAFKKRRFSIDIRS